MLLMIDNYDSFTYNLVHYFQQLGQDVVVVRNDEITTDEIYKLNPDYLVISPGPCDPDAAGISLDVIAKFKGLIPILGVCLGHQCIAQHFGGNVVRAKQVMHGKTSIVAHHNSDLFLSLNNPLRVTRYHSLVVDNLSIPDCLEITAQIKDTGEIMGIRHKTLPVCGVQFHPESVLTEQGHELLSNFLNIYSGREHTR